ncbi:hypothetical protein [Candidatus Nitrosocosmicus sp. R]
MNNNTGNLLPQSISYGESAITTTSILGLVFTALKQFCLILQNQKLICRIGKYTEKNSKSDSDILHFIN